MPSAHRVEWAPVALRDLDRILDSIDSRDGGDAAEALGRTVLDKISRLAVSPLRCRIVPELRDIGVLDLREQILDPYRAIFVVRGEVVSIVAHFDGRRDLRELLIERATRELP